jgi:hypothetical protein
VVAEGLPAGTQILEARLDGEDALPLDDRAWAVNRSGEPTPVTCVTEGNLFLETALALFPNLEVTVVRPADLGSSDAEAEGDPPPQPKLTILDAYVPVTTTLPAGNLLFIAPPRSTEYFSVTGTIDQPRPRAVTAIGGDAVDPLVAHVNLSEVSVLKAARVPLPEWARTAIAGDVTGEQGEAMPLLFSGQRDGRRIAVLTFDLHNSDLTLQVAYPLLMANLIGWLAPLGDGTVPTQVAPNAPLSWAVPPEVSMVQVTRPDGSPLRLTPEGGNVLLSDTAQLGVYQVQWGEDANAAFAVNLFSPQESDIAPAPSLPLAGTEGEGETRDLLRARREWWRPLAFAALTLLIVEWAIYQRATLSRLWAGIKRQAAEWAGR